MSNNHFVHYQNTAIGTIGIAEYRGFITNLFFDFEAVNQEAQIFETELISRAFRQLNDYLCGKLKTFSIPLNPFGTVFMMQIWEVLCTIPYGNIMSYKDVAAAAGNSSACRAVGMANHRTPIPVFIPCHRVIGSDGALTGYRGGLDLKKQLLALEQRFRYV